MQTKIMGWVSIIGASKIELKTSTAACAMRAGAYLGQDCQGRVTEPRRRVDLAQDLEGSLCVRRVSPGWRPSSPGRSSSGV